MSNMHRSMIAILALCLPCHQNSYEKGWWDSQKKDDQSLDEDLVWKQIPEKLALIHSEVSEALEDLRVGKMETSLDPKGKPIGFFSELADVVIRMFDLLGAMRAATEFEMSFLDHFQIWNYNMNTDFSLAEDRSLSKLMLYLEMMHYHLSAAFYEWSDFSAKEDGSEWDREWFMESLGKCLLLIWRLHDDLEEDLLKEIQQKMEFNKSRPYRHGGKLA